MQIVRRTLAITLALWLAAPQIQAQVVTPAPPSGTQAIIDQALVERASRTVADRDAVRRVLERPEVKQVAGRMGIDISRLQSGVGVLDARELAEAAEHARAIDRNLAGGATTVTITTTTIIIALLIVILIVLIAD